MEWLLIVVMETSRGGLIERREMPGFKSWNECIAAGKAIGQEVSLKPRDAALGRFATNIDCKEQRGDSRSSQATTE